MTTNKIAEMFNLEYVKQKIANCPKDEIVILCGHWSINKPRYSEDEDPETENWDLDELEQELGHLLMVNDYDDLICDPHGLMSL
jgi:hypothetical protein